MLGAAVLQVLLHDVGGDSVRKRVWWDVLVDEAACAYCCPNADPYAGHDSAVAADLCPIANCYFSLLVVDGRDRVDGTVRPKLCTGTYPYAGKGVDIGAKADITLLPQHQLFRMPNHPAPFGRDLVDNLRPFPAVILKALFH